MIAQSKALADSDSTILISPITVAEVGAGALDHQREKVNRILASRARVPVDREVGQLAGEYLRRYSKSHNLGIGDALIAVSAAWSQAALWTGNRQHYPMPELVMHA